MALDRLAKALGISRLSAKFEHCNPTGSYKDRIAARSMVCARDRGNAGWIATSSGNGGAALAAYGNRAGLPGLLFVVSGAPREKLLALAPYGVAIRTVVGVGVGGSGRLEAALMSAVREVAASLNLYLGVTAYAFNPEGMRGAESIGVEIVEQVPDVTEIYVPAGGGGLIVAVSRGTRSTGAAVRSVACQPTGCAPIVGALQGVLASPAVEVCTSAISALQLPRPPDGELAVKTVQETAGWGGMASDRDILNAQAMLSEVEGIFVEPASAATLAILRQDVVQGRVTKKSHPVLVLTGTGLKELTRYRTAYTEFAVSADDVTKEATAWWQAR